MASLEAHIQLSLLAAIGVSVLSSLQFTLDAMHILFLVILVFGAYIWLYSWKYMGKAWSLENKPVGSLITSGPYKYVRHPLYFGSIMGLSSLSFFSSSYIPIILVVVFILATAMRARKEDKLMKEKFGEEWVKYSKISGFILPKFVKKKQI
jgi:protein-S-isoprenylcysteine O-methyltransferase Ste14